MKLIELKEIVDQAVKDAEGRPGAQPAAEFWIGEKHLEVAEISQFELVPDLVFVFREDEWEEFLDEK